MQAWRVPTLVVGLAAALLAAAKVQDPPFEEEIRQYEAADRKSPPREGGVVFVGSSSIRMWSTLGSDFPGVNVINRGFGGSQLSDSVRYVHRIVTPYKPKMVVLFAGTNDIAGGKSPEQVYEDYRQFVGEVRSKLPDTRIAFISITPAPSRWSMVEKFKAVNGLVRKHTLTDEGLIYIDMFDHFLDSSGSARPELFVSDRLHLNERGYEIWRKVVGPFLPWQ